MKLTSKLRFFFVRSPPSPLLSLPSNMIKFLFVSVFVSAFTYVSVCMFFKIFIKFWKFK